MPVPYQGDNPYLMALLEGTGRRPHVISYSFKNGPYRDWVPAEKAAVLAAIKAWEAVADITFVLNESGTATFDFRIEEYNTNTETTLGLWSPKNKSITFYDRPGFYKQPRTSSGIDTSWQSDLSDGKIDVGGFVYRTMVHEIGHAIGLKHPHKQKPEDLIYFPGATTIRSLGEHQQNDGINTIMSYNYHNSWAPTSRVDYGFLGGPMALDIAAIREIYGPSKSKQNIGDTVYTLPNREGDGLFTSCIVDDGGTDTIRASSRTDVDFIIDLRPAYLTEGPNAGGFWSHGRDFGPEEIDEINAGFTIAANVKIENAVGGNGHDTITGNNWGNVIKGLNGLDTITGLGGSDTIYGGDGPDYIYGDNDFSEYKGSTEKIWDGELGRAKTVASINGIGADWSRPSLDYLGNGEGLYAPNRVPNRPNFDGGKDKLYGEDGGDSIFGGGGDDFISGGSGEDELRGGSGMDTLWGGTDRDYLNGGSGSDKMYGGQGSDIYISLGAEDIIVENPEFDNSGASIRDTLLFNQKIYDWIDPNIETIYCLSIEPSRIIVDLSESRGVVSGNPDGSRTYHYQIGAFCAGSDITVENLPGINDALVGSSLVIQLGTGTETNSSSGVDRIRINPHVAVETAISIDGFTTGIDKIDFSGYGINHVVRSRFDFDENATPAPGRYFSYSFGEIADCRIVDGRAVWSEPYHFFVQPPSWDHRGFAASDFVI